jgi:hypothetical protein
MCICNEPALTQTSLIEGERSTRWIGNIIPGVDVPVIPLTLTMQTQPVNTITKIDKTIPNLEDIAKMEKVDVSEINRVLALRNDLLPGKSRRANHKMNEFSKEETIRMSNYCKNALQCICKIVLHKDPDALFTTVADGTENMEWAEISKRWTEIALLLPACAERNAILAFICNEESRKNLPSISKESFSRHRRNAKILMNGNELPTRANLYTRYNKEVGFEN